MACGPWPPAHTPSRGDTYVEDSMKMVQVIRTGLRPGDPRARRPSP